LFSSLTVSVTACPVYALSTDAEIDISRLPLGVLVGVAVGVTVDVGVGVEVAVRV